MLVGSTSASLYIGSNRVKAARQGASLRYFRPDSIPGLQAWWDASDTGSLTLNGANVSAVADKSGNGNTLSQANAAAQPAYTANLTNSLSGFTVTGGTDYMVGSVDGFKSFTGLTVFCVGESSGAAAADQNTAVWWSWGHFGNASSPYPAFRGLSYGSGTGALAGETQVTNVEYGSTGRIGSSVYSRSANSPTIESITVGSSGTQVYQYGSQVSQNLLSLATLLADYSPASIGYTLDDDVFLSALRIGGTPVLLPAAGDIGYGEVLIFDSQLSAADRQLVEGYLAWKWGLQAKLPYNHPYAPQAIGGGSQTVPTDSDVLAFAAASGAKSIPDLNKIEDLVTYLKAQGLWNYARFYPMKSSQNAGTGSTVYGLGGLTTNNMTLVNSPTWGSDGVTFDAASSQCGTVSDCLSDASVSFWWRGTATTDNWLISQYDSNAFQRSIGILMNASSANLLRSSTGLTSNDIESYSGDKPSAGDTVSAEWVDGGGRSYYINNAEQSLSLVSGAAQTSRLSTSTPIALMSAYASGSPAGFSSGTVVLAGFIETVLTTTQREAITDLINAL